MRSDFPTAARVRVREKRRTRAAVEKSSTPQTQKFGYFLDFSRPGKPTDNAHVESFNGRLREECLNSHWFISMEDAKRAIEAWRTDYNENRPHRALENRTPQEFAIAAKNCTCSNGE